MKKIDYFSEDIKDKIRNRMQEIDRNLPLDELLKTHVQYDSNKQSKKIIKIEIMIDNRKGIPFLYFFKQFLFK